MNEIEKIARRLVRKCVSEVDGNFWFDRTKAAAIIKEVLAAATKRAEDLQAHYDRDTAKLQQEIARLTTRVKEYREKVEQLETDKAFYYDKWLNALE